MSQKPAWEMPAPPGQFAVFQAFDALKGAISKYEPKFPVLQQNSPCFSCREKARAKFPVSLI